MSGFHKKNAFFSALPTARFELLSSVVRAKEKRNFMIFIHNTTGYDTSSFCFLPVTLCPDPSHIWPPQARAPRMLGFPIEPATTALRLLPSGPRRRPLLQEKRNAELLYCYWRKGWEEHILSIVQEHMFVDKNCSREDLRKCWNISNTSNQQSSYHCRGYEDGERLQGCKRKQLQCI